ncbi:MAG TPA: ABC transporter permease [Candidatus Obscuribacterales bacterium]
MRAFADTGFTALLVKEFHQLLRNRQLLFMLLFFPVLQVCMYGFCLDPEVKHRRVGIVDLSDSPDSRAFVSAFARSQVFDIVASGSNEKELARRVRDGHLEMGVVIPPEFARRLKAGQTPRVQIVLDGVDANAAGIAAGYLAQIVANLGLEMSAARATSYPDAVRPKATFMYNPGLVAPWFFVPGVMGIVLNVVGIMVSSATLLREKETGTMEQLLMTPVSSAEILIAKIVPLVAVLFATISVALTTGMAIFQMPFRGNPVALLVISLLYVFVVISIGIALSTVAGNQRQAMLISFFISLPVILLSGAITPLESMPPFFQDLSMLNPLRYYIVCLKGILLKGVGLAALWPNVLALVGFAGLLFFVSAARFRRQMA